MRPQAQYTGHFSHHTAAPEPLAPSRGNGRTFLETSIQYAIVATNITPRFAYQFTRLGNDVSYGQNTSGSTHRFRWAARRDAS